MNGVGRHDIPVASVSVKRTKSEDVCDCEGAREHEQVSDEGNARRAMLLLVIVKLA
jgi:hypothetical protein